MNFTGCFTALVTPFRQGEIDWDSLATLIDFQIENGIDGLVPCGTTGESATLTHEEHRKVIEFVIEKVNGRCAVIAGTGSNATREALEMTRFAEQAGADGALLVTPYYNKPTQEGLYQHFAQIAGAVQIPMVLYNIPGRSGVPITPETLARLSELRPIAAMKEASGDLDVASAYRQVCDLPLLSGNDSQTVGIYGVGGQGVISVASNLLPRDLVTLTRVCAEGDRAEALRLHDHLFPLFQALFLETNPIPIKAALAMAGRMADEFRLPLVPLGDTHRPALKKTLADLGVV